MNSKTETYQVWEYIVAHILPALLVNQRAEAIQSYIQQGGPVPDDLGDKVRTLLKRTP